MRKILASTKTTIKLSSFLMVSLLVLSSACKKSVDDSNNSTAFTCASCKTTADALAANNTISKGVYKGVVIGSTGIITIDILNSGTTIKATLVLDGQTVVLNSSSNWVAGQSFTASFTGTANSQTYSFNFSVTGTGATPIASGFSIPGHPNISFQLIKETSDNLIKCYEGTSEGIKDSGKAQAATLNIITSGKTNTWFALSRDNGSTSINTADGTISGTTLNCNCGPNTTIVGTVTADEIKGTYKGQDNHGTFMAKRTL
ncbi:MAG: hypothetical protein JWQ25_2964 [Daejeonella sp.]|nr:hypothetical protein [Daejeonella sp.]